jgi:putative hydrolase
MINDFLPVDLHTHTCATAHAFSTLFENIMIAKEKGMKMIAITDHGPDLPDSPHPFHYWNQQSSIPAVVNGIIVLKGIEANFIKGGITDCSDKLYQALDIVIGGCHPHVLTNADIDENTQIVISILKSGHLDILTHPGDPSFPKDYEAIIKTAADLGIVIEINSSSGISSRRGSTPNCIEIAKLCVKHQVQMCINSDAHFCTNVGNFKHAFEIVREASVPQELILNTSPLKVLNYLQQRGHTSLTPYFEYLAQQNNVSVLATSV